MRHAAEYVCCRWYRSLGHVSKVQITDIWGLWGCWGLAVSDRDREVTTSGELADAFVCAACYPSVSFDVRLHDRKKNGSGLQL